MRDTEDMLVRRLLTGDERALASLYDLHADRLYRYAFSRTLDRQDAQEVVQDTFITAWRKPGSIRLVQGSALAWLLTVVRNHALNSSKKRARQQRLAIQAAAEPSAAGTIDEALRAAEMRVWLERIIKDLAPVDRQLISLCVFDDISYEEAAALLNLSVQASRKRMQRIRRVLTRTRLVEEVE